MKIRQYFIADETNDYQPWILKPTALITFCLIIWGVRIFVPAGFSFAAGGIDPYDVMARINSERSNRFIPELVTNSKLISAATAKSNDMLARSYFAHVDPDGNYVWGRIEAAGYVPYLTLGENLGIDFASAAALVEAWMNSPTHRANIVNQKFQDQGLAAIFDQYGQSHSTIAITSLFGTLQKKQATPPPPPPPSQATKTPTPPPAPKPVAKTPTPAPTPKPPPSQAPTPTPPPVAEAVIEINPDIKISKKLINNEQILEVDVIVSGSPAKVEGTIKDKTVTLLASAITGQYLGVFTFPKEIDLSSELLSVSAGTAKREFDLSSIPAGDQETTFNTLPSSSQGSESQFIKILQIIFGILAGVYVIFLVIDSIIIHRARIKRNNIHSSPHSLLFLLIFVINLLTAF